MPRARLRALATGQVQRVGFRYFVTQLADQLDLTGWVRNTPDGAVEVVAEGERSALETLLEYLHAGPRHADVERVDPEWLDDRGEFHGFRVTG